ncbi:hypothetical protein [Kribbella qitaiheensis]|uniref:hypothetical protein n=1 Tax=Kribbella qitaiheensis TaxID=1544730 RepID=UPI001FE7D12C|nr:hypothetical protein [Kribbella qitaiheensis]
MIRATIWVETGPSRSASTSSGVVGFSSSSCAQESSSPLPSLSIASSTEKAGKAISAAVAIGPSPISISGFPPASVRRR